MDSRLETKFAKRLKIQPQLTRQLVSFQANKERPGYRWYKYKEAFSASLVEYFLHEYETSDGCILDPFAGMGTTLFCASSLGLDSVGIELLPLGRELIETRQLLESSLSKADLLRLREWCKALDFFGVRRFSAALFCLFFVKTERRKAAEKRRAPKKSKAVVQ